MKSSFPKPDKSTFGTSEKNRFLWQNLYTCLWENKIFSSITISFDFTYNADWVVNHECFHHSHKGNKNNYTIEYTSCQAHDTSRLLYRKKCILGLQGLQLISSVAACFEIVTISSWYGRANYHHSGSNMQESSIQLFSQSHITLTVQKYEKSPLWTRACFDWLSYSHIIFMILQWYNSPGDRAIHHSGCVCWTDSLPPSQPVSQEHLPVCYGQASHG